MDIDIELRATTSNAVEKETPLLQSNGLLSDFQDPNPSTEPEAMTARKQLDMLTSNGILEGAADADVMRSLEQGAQERRSQSPRNKSKFENANVQEASVVVQEEFLGNGLLFGGTSDDAIQPASSEKEIGSAIISVTAAPELATHNPQAIGTSPTSTADVFQANGLLSSMDEQPTGDVAMKDVTVPSLAANDTVVVSSGFEANGLLGDFDVPPADEPATVTSAVESPRPDTVIAPPTEEAPTNPDTSSLDQLLDELDSAGYTTLQKGKARAVSFPTTKKFPTLAPTSRSPTPALIESATESPVETGYPHMNLVMMTEEAQNLVPLEAVDEKGRKVVFKRRPRKVVDGRAVSSLDTTRKCDVADAFVVV